MRPPAHYQGSKSGIQAGGRICRRNPSSPKLLKPYQSEAPLNRLAAEQEALAQTLSQTRFCRTALSQWMDRRDGRWVGGSQGRRVGGSEYEVISAFHLRPSEDMMPRRESLQLTLGGLGSCSS